jgi:hypothetical protein
MEERLRSEYLGSSLSRIDLRTINMIYVVVLGADLESYYFAVLLAAKDRSIQYYLEHRVLRL